VTEDQAGIEVELADGRVLTTFVEASLGNLRKPMSNRQLEDKFRNQALLALPAAQVERAIERCRSVASLEDVNALVEATLPVAVRA
jgi:2-methylcitrate dehydratase PrpD